MNNTEVNEKNLHLNSQSHISNLTQAIRKLVDFLHITINCAVTQHFQMLAIEI